MRWRPESRRQGETQYSDPAAQMTLPVYFTVSKTIKAVVKVSIPDRNQRRTAISDVSSKKISV